MCNISAGFFRDGVSEGFFKGKDEGRIDERIEIIKTMLGDNRTVQEIASILHFPVEEVKKVQKSLTP